MDEKMIHNNKTPAVIDWPLGLQLAGNNKALATDLLNLLAKTLAAEIRSIRQAYDNQQTKELGERLHKLHGAVCYCGTPRLKQALVTLEKALKEHQLQFDPALIAQCEQESELVLKAIHNEYSVST